MSIFERYLTVWVGLAMIAGVVIGQGHDLQTIGHPTHHQFLWRQGAIRGGGVHVQVYIKIMGNHGII